MPSHLATDSHNFKLEEFELLTKLYIFLGINTKRLIISMKIFKNSGLPVTSRNVAFLLQTPQQDVGNGIWLCHCSRNMGCAKECDAGKLLGFKWRNKYLNKNFAKTQKCFVTLVARGAAKREINETQTINARSVRFT